MRQTLKAFVVLSFLVLPVIATAQESRVSLVWDANAEPDLAGYKVYWGQTSREYTFSQDNGNQTTATIGLLPPGNWYFAVTAYDNFKNESGFSNEVMTVVMAPPPPVVPPGTPVPTTLADGVRWDWPPCENCSGYLYRYQGVEGETTELTVTIPSFSSSWFCVTAKEVGWDDSTLYSCNRYTPPPPDVTPPTPPTGLTIDIPSGTTKMRIEFLK